MWELDGEESWALKNWCFWTVVWEETLESPLECKEMQPIHPEEDQNWVFIGKTDIEAETPILWPSYAKSWFIGKCQEPAWGILPVTRSWGRKPNKMQGRDQASGVFPGISWASTPQKIRICLLFHSFDIFWKKSNQGFSFLHLKGMFQLNPSDSSLACLTGSPTSFTACELLTAPPTQPQEAQSLKAS